MNGYSDSLDPMLYGVGSTAPGNAFGGGNLGTELDGLDFFNDSDEGDDQGTPGNQLRLPQDQMDLLDSMNIRHAPPISNQYFGSHRDIAVHLNVFAEAEGFAIVTKRTRKRVINGSNIYINATFTCARGGEVRHRNQAQYFLEPDRAARTREKTTRQTGCTWEVQASLVDLRVPSRGWEYSVVDNNHNHVPADRTAFIEHRAIGPIEREHAHNQFYLNARTSQVLQSLRHINPDFLGTLQDVQNLRNRWQAARREGATDAESTLHMLNARAATATYRALMTNGRLEGLLITTPNQLRLAQTFPEVMIMDCTYKTNAYRLPLLHIVGMTAENETFTAAAIVIVKESIEWYGRALDAFKQVMGTSVDDIKVIVTDRDEALMHTLNEKFPQAKRMLCAWHINQNLVAAGRVGVEEDVWTQFEKDWKRWVVYSRTVEGYNAGVVKFKNTYKNEPSLSKGYSYAIVTMH